MVDNNQSSYRSIFKATSLFGGVQVFQILIQIVKSKFVAILLGPAGVGIVGLYQSGLQLIQSFTNMGLAQSGVRDVSEALGSNDIQQISKILTVVKRLVWITGLLGVIITSICSPLLSKSLFGNYDYVIPFIILSVTLLFDQLAAGQRVVLQGLRRLKDLAKCSAYGVTIGLLTSIPIYYWLGVDGIVPTLILHSICTLFLTWIYAKKIKNEKTTLSIRQTMIEGKLMLVMGVSMSLSSILSTFAAFIIRGFIQGTGGVEQVGLYQAGFVIMTTYVGMVMNAIATDYYPRLSSINKDNTKCCEVVCQQGEIATMILAPLLSICVIFMPFVLKLLYSDSFLDANNYISWACLGMMFKLSSWILAYLVIAKADSKIYIVNEIITNTLNVIFSLVGYRYYDLAGIGIASTLHYIIYFLQMYFVSKLRYQFSFSKRFIKCYSIQVLLVASCLLVVLITSDCIKYIVGGLIIILSCVLSIIGLNRRMNFLGLIKNIRN